MLTFLSIFIYLSIYLSIVFLPFLGYSVAYGGSQARGPIGAVATSLRNNAGSKPRL